MVVRYPIVATLATTYTRIAPAGIPNTRPQTSFNQNGMSSTAYSFLSSSASWARCWVRRPVYDGVVMYPPTVMSHA